jgi:hypothetical protein
MKVATYATLVNEKVIIPSARTQYIAVEKNHLISFLSPTLRQIYVDDDWYIRSNPDIVEAISSGIFSDPKHHYVACGYFEHRMPYEIIVDENWYLEHYPDVGEAVQAGTFSGARDHFYAAGYREGRLPHASFSLREAT